MSRIVNSGVKKELMFPSAPPQLVRFPGTLDKHLAVVAVAKQQELCQVAVIQSEEEGEDEGAVNVAWTSVVPCETRQHQETTSGLFSAQVGASC